MSTLGARYICTTCQVNIGDIAFGADMVDTVEAITTHLAANPDHEVMQRIILVADTTHVT